MDNALVDVIECDPDKPKLSEFRDTISDAMVAGVLAATASHTDWNPSVVGEALQPMCDSIDWANAFSLLELPNQKLELKLSSPAALANLLNTVASITQDKKAQVVSQFLSRKWTKLQYQSDIVLQASNLAPDELDLASLGLPSVIDSRDYSDAPAHIQSIAATLVRQPLNYRHLVHLSLDAICREGDPSVAAARAFLDMHAKLVPEIFFLGGITMPRPWHPLLDRVISNFFELFFAGHSSRPLVFYYLSKIDKRFFIDALIEIFDRDSSTIGHILAVAHEANILEDLLNVTHFKFTLELAAHADKQNVYSFDAFLNASLNQGAEFIRSLLDFLEIKATVEYTQNQAAGRSPTGLNLLSVAAALGLVSRVEIPPDRIEQLKAIQIQCLQSYPRLINFGQGHDAAILAHGDVNSFTPDIEREMKLYYQKMYEQKIEIRDIIAMLQRLKKSDDPHDQDVFACMVHSLFDEYRFFPEYPLNALATTAVLFGSLVYFQLIEGLPLSIALRFILDAVKQPPDSNMFRFGLQALFEFRQRLHEFPKYCKVLMEIPGLSSHQQFYQQIKDIAAGGGPTTAADAGTRPEIEIAPPPPPKQDFRSLDAEVAVTDTTPQEDPPENVSDKVLFIVNNIAQNNVIPKSKELATILDSRYYSWFASYIVQQRSMQEPNYHSLYIEMLTLIGSKDLERNCLKVTYRNIIRLLNNPDTITSSEKRSQLKHLGQWLGSLLLVRDRPILHKNIAFKRLLVEGYTLNRLAVVIPFVCKTLERASASTVFLPPNPWLMGIMQVLSELYQSADLKLNLKFEIEVLCNALNLDINEVPASTVIHNETTEDLDAAGANLAVDIQNLRIGKEAEPLVVSQFVREGGEPGAADVSVYSNVINQLTFNGSTGFATHPTLKRIFQLAIEKSIREILQPVVERSSTIAALAARELVTKDFALEPDEQKIRIAAQNVVRVLAGSISLVTCKDPLRESLAANLRSLMVANGYADHNILLEQIVLAVNDNVDLICSIVENAAVEKSYGEIEDALSQSYFMRKRHRENRGNQPFVDPQLTSRYPLQLPDPFRLKPGGLLPQQFAIYENFGKFRPVVDYAVSETDGHPTGEASSPPFMGGGGDQHPRQVAMFEQLIIQMQNGVDSLEKLIKESTETSLSQLSPDHKLRVLVSQILTVVSRSAFRDDIILKTAQMTVNALFTLTDSQLGREVLCFLLDRLCELSFITAKEVVMWLIYSDDERKFNVPVMVTLLKAKLITASEIDATLAKHVMDKVDAAISFAAGLISEVVLGENSICLRTELAGCLEAMEVLAADEPPNQVAQKLLQSLEAATGRGPLTIEDGEITLKDQMGYVFAEWTRLAQRSSRTERSLHVFVFEMAKQGILSDSELLCTFVRTAIQISVESYKTATSTVEGLAAIDALAKLLVTILKTNDKMDMNNRVNYAKNLLSIIMLVFASDHDTQLENFNGRPYFRLLSSVLYELTELVDEPEFLENLYILLANAFITLQPLAFPGFVFAWMTLISHRHFMPKLLDLPEKKGWPYLANLLGCLVRFQGEYIDGIDFPEPIAVMYKGTLRIFLVILHDYPQFLIENHYSLCNDIPSSFVQLRNLVLSAFPDSIQLPDPLTQGLKVDRLPEIKQLPTLAIDPAADLQRFGLKKLVDTYIKSPSPAIVKALAGGLGLGKSKKEIGVGFDKMNVNYAGLNALVLYVGDQAVRSGVTTSSKSGSSDDDSSAHFNRDSVHLAVLAQLMAKLNIEGQYFLCEAMANQLRYPNAHTHYFSCVILSLFGNYGTIALGDEKFSIQHLITRVLLERIICNRPHPWGLMITFTELLKNSNYKFWDLPFTKTTPEVSIVNYSV
jgi:CCR4-NOT transcription complex subunit 1